MLLGVFYLMVNLYHRANTVLRGYRYLGAMEDEIRARLGLDADSASFTRERRFYWTHRSRGLETVKYTYTVLLGLLLVFFLYGRLQYDLGHTTSVFLALDSLISLATLFYFALYAGSSIRMERQEERKGNPKKAPTA